MTHMKNFIDLVYSSDKDELKDMRRTIDNRLGELNAVSKAQAFASLKIGDRVRIASNVKPKYLAGATATVTKKNVSRVVVDFDVPHNRFYKNVTCPPDMLELT
jgi:hypothetical protein